MASSRKDNQTPDAEQTGSVNAGVKGDFRSPYQEYPRGENQHDDVNHYTGIGADVFAPVRPRGDTPTK